MDFERVAKLVEYLQRFIGTVYRWGGDDPVGGFDCSGLVSEGLRALGWLRWDERLGSGQFADRFHDLVVDDDPLLGDVLCWPGHVAVAVDERTMIEAGGGGPSTTTEGEAAKDNAFVRLRPISMRPRPAFVIRLAGQGE